MGESCSKHAKDRTLRVEEGFLRRFALIPARRGSKGLARKNVLPLGGKPLLSYTIDAALDSNVFDSIVVSSDCKAALELAKRASIHPLMRPHNISQDWSRPEEVVDHFIDVVLKNYQLSECLIFYLQPTSPFRTSEHIKQVYQRIKENGSFRFISVTELDRSLLKAFSLSASGELEALFAENYSNMSRQFLPKLYKPNGAIYTFLASEFMRNHSFPNRGSLPFIMSDVDSLDIDTADNFRTAEELMENS